MNFEVSEQVVSSMFHFNDQPFDLTFFSYYSTASSLWSSLFSQRFACDWKSSGATWIVVILTLLCHLV